MAGAPRRQTIRLIVHVPPQADGHLASWSLVSVIEGGPVPVGEVWLHGHIPLGGPRATESGALEAIDRIVSQYLLY